MSLLSDQEIQNDLSGLDTWSKNGHSIERAYTFNTFLDGIHFVNQVAQIAERLNHHPDVVIQYKKVTLTLTTHDAGGLTELDMQSAKEYDHVFERL